MSEQNRTVGYPCWHEVYTGDPGSVASFYSQLFGWSTQELEMGGTPYIMFMNNDHHVGGIEALTDPAQAPYWLTYISVTDTDRAAELANTNGGRVIKEPFDIPGVGRCAIIADPQGVVFALYANPGDSEAPAEPGRGDFCWEEIMTSDPAGSTDFLATVLEWPHDNMSVTDHDYTVFKAGERSVAGLMAASPEMPGSFWLSYIWVDNVDEMAARATELGGKVTLPPTDIPKVGRVAILQDPTGAQFGIYKSATG